MRTDGFDRVVCRYYASGVWVSTTALHSGCGRGALDTSVDAALVRDSDGRFLLPAASLAGAIRSRLARRFAASAEDFQKGTEPRALEAMFGGRDAKSGYASLLVIEDSLAAGKPAPTIRDGVRIDPVNGLPWQASGKGAVFNVEVLPAGTSFPLCLELQLYQQNPEGVEEKDLLRCFRAALEELGAEDGIRLGARTRRGYGCGKVGSWEIYRLDMSKEEHVRAWLRRNPRDGEKVTLTGLPAPALAGPALARFRIQASFRLLTSLLIRSAPNQPQEPDHVHLTESGRALLTGTSLAGAVRHRCLRIANTLKLELRDAILADLFGPQNPADGKANPRAGRIWFGESVLEHGERFVQGRVSIDRFTGGAKEALLFDEAPFWPVGNDPHVELRIAVDQPDPCDVALLALAIKDLWLGDLPLGGEVAVGRGVFAGAHATFEASDGRRFTMKAQAGGLTLEGDAEWLESAVRGLPAAAAGWGKRHPLPEALPEEAVHE